MDSRNPNDNIKISFFTEIPTESIETPMVRNQNPQHIKNKLIINNNEIHPQAAELQIHRQPDLPAQVGSSQTPDQQLQGLHPRHHRPHHLTQHRDSLKYPQRAELAPPGEHVGAKNQDKKRAQVTQGG